VLSFTIDIYGIYRMIRSVPSSSADGTVRIYEAPDVMNLSQWSLQYEIPVKIQCR
jgi:hypothetical protein